MLATIGVQYISDNNLRRKTPKEGPHWQVVRVCSHKGVNNKSKIKKSQKDGIKFVIAGENATKSLEAAKKPFNLIALFV